MTYHTEGIILKRETWRETGRIYTVYTREAGKLLALGRGTRKVLSKLASHLEPYTTADLFIARGRRYETLAGASMTRSPEPLVANDERHVAVSFFAEAVDHFVKWGEKDEELWGLMDGFLEDLSNIGKDRLPHRLAGFLWKFMDHLGYGPLLHQCSVCETEKLHGAAWFLPTSGTVACRTCRPEERSLVGAELVDAVSLEELKAFFLDPEKKEIRTPTAIRAGHIFAEVHFDRPLISLPILRQVLPLPETAPVLQ